METERFKFLNHQLQQQEIREQLVAAIALRIRESLNLEEVLNSAVKEIRQLLQTDRVLIYRFEQDGSGIVTTESVSESKWSILERVVKDDCFGQNWLARYQQGHIHAIADIDESDLNQCYWEFLAGFQVRANLAVPIVVREKQQFEPAEAETTTHTSSDRLWGLLIAHQCSLPRFWQAAEIDLLQQLATQIAIAIQQSQLHQQLQNELQERRQAEELYKVLVTSAPVGIFQTDVLGHCLFVNQRWQELTGLSLSEALGQGWIKALHPQDRDRVSSEWYDTAQTGREFSLEYRFITPQDEVIWVAGRAVPLYNEEKNITGYLGTVTDISERKRREEILKDIASGVTAQTGEHFFPSLVEYLTKALQVDYASVCILVTPQREKVKTLAFYDKRQGKVSLENFEYDLAGTPCETVVAKELRIYPNSIQTLFSDDLFLQEIKAESYAGMPIFAQTGQALGLISIIDSKPLKNHALITEVLKIFAIRATSELERQQTELALRQSERRFRGIFDQTFQFIGLLEPNGNIIEANQTALNFIGLTLADVIGKPFWLTPWWSDSVEIQERLQQAIKLAAQGEFVRFEADHPGKENRLITVDFSLTPVKDETGQVVMLIPEGRNISDRKQAEEQIRQQAALLDLAHDAILVRNLDNSITFWNRGAEAMYGWTKAEAIGKISHQLLETKFSQPLEEIETHLLQQGHWEGELLHRKQDGAWLTVIGRWSLQVNENGQPNCILEINHNITQRKQAEEQIRQQATLLDVATDAIMVQGLNNRLVFWNQGAERLYGWTKAEALNQNANEFLYLDYLPQFDEILQILTEKGRWQGELKQVTKTGHNIIVESRWTLVKDRVNCPQSILVVNTDITEKKQLETQFLRAQRLESLGTLASGIAHDLNNILTPILAAAQLLPMHLPDLNPNLQRLLTISKINAERGASLVKQILSFTRGSEGDRGIVAIGQVIAEVKRIAEETFPKNIAIDTSLPENLWTVIGDVTQLHQVLMNLAVNARDAMPDGGQLIISAENLVIDSNYARTHLDATEGAYVLIAVSDTGVGITPEILDRIFEPFFTTKAIGKGTGLGLSTVLGIVKSHGGFINVSNEVTQGTQFQIFLPANQASTITLVESQELPQGNGELILVVDDEANICQVNQQLLQTYNYRVLIAQNGIDAIALYTEANQEIAIVLMDLMMPGMDGAEVITTLQKINPQVKIIAVSGLAQSKQNLVNIGNNIKAFLPKPYTAEALLHTIKQVI